MRLSALKSVASACAACILSAGAAVAQPPPPTFPPLPAVPVPPANPITEAKRVLGKALFWDEQLSTDNTVSCGTCHLPASGGGDPRRVRTPGPDGLVNTPDDIFGSPGVSDADEVADYVRSAIHGTNPQVTGRASMSMINAAYAPELFWDGRARNQFVDPQTGQVAINNGGGLESQSVGPPLSDIEMAHAGRDWNEVAAKLARVRPLAIATNIPADIAPSVGGSVTYGQLFAAAFGDEAITARRIAFAIATYQRTLIANDTPWDRFNAGQQTAMTPQQVQGFQAFLASNCQACHTPPHFTNHGFRNIGVRPPAEDLGRQIVTGNVNDRGRFKVPTLRNSGLKGTFMHNGVFTTIPQVLGFYAQGPNAPVRFTDNLDPVLNTVNVPPQAVGPIDNFIRNALTDARVAAEQFPFDRPTLYSQRPADRPVSLGGGVAGTGGVVARVVALDPPFVGNLDFRIGLDGALSGAAARLIISNQAPVGGRLLDRSRMTDPLVTEGAGANALATFHWPLLTSTTRAGQALYVQWAIADPAAPGGEALSEVVRLTPFCGSIGCPEVCIADVASAASGDPLSGPDGFVTGADFDAFVGAFFGEWKRPDQTYLADVADGAGETGPDGFLTGTDFDVFLNGFFKGC